MSNSRYKTHRGREFNMSAFAEKNGDTRAVGNSSMNARGDIVDAKGNVKIPTQTISRVLSDVKNNDSKSVSLKADESITPVQNSIVKAEEQVSPTTLNSIVSSKEIKDMEGNIIATEIEYADGSMQVIQKPKINPMEL